MDYQERDRLGLSIIISAILYALFFAAFWFVPWDEFEPFPEPDPILLVELEEFAVREAPEPPVPAETAMEVEQPVPAEEPPAPAPPPVPPTPTPQPAAPRPAPPVVRTPPAQPAPRPAPTPPAAQTPAPQPSRPAAPAEQSVPPPPPGSSFRAGEPRFDPRLAAEIEFLENEKAGLEKYLRDNAPQYLPDAPPPPAGPTAARPATDPVAEQIREDLINVTRKIQALRQSAGEPLAASPPPPSTVRPPSRPPESQPIRDAAGREIGTGQLEGRIPQGGLALVLTREDFDGSPPPSITITAEFEIFESGAVDPNPATLKISGDLRYTKVNEKIRAALRSWRFSPRPGVRTKASISFEIKSSDVVR